MRLILLATVFAGAIALGFFTGTLTRQKVLVPSSRAAAIIPIGAPCTNPNGCGGSCKLTINNGCGYGGCRIWEQCGGNGQCLWQGVTQSCEKYIDYTPQSLQSPTEQGTDADWTCMGEIADSKVRELRNYDWNAWRNDKIAKTIADCNLDTNYTYDCSSEITPECAQIVHNILAQWGFSNLANTQTIQENQEIAEPAQESTFEKIANANAPAAQLTWNPVEGTTLYSLSIRYNGKTFTRDTSGTDYLVYPYELNNETGSGRWTFTAKKGNNVLFTSPEYEFIVTNTQEEAQVEPVVVAEEEANPQYCETITNEEGAFTLVFIPDRYSDLEEFATNIAEVIEDIDKTNLPQAFRSNIRFAVYARIPENPLTSELGNEESTSVVWDRARADAIKTVCNADDYMILAKWPHKSGTAFWSGGAAIANSSVNVASHELGHNIAKLDDEYVYATKDNEDTSEETASPGPNCTTDSSCALWRAQTQGIVCMPGCHFGHWYRPTDNSIMRNPYISHEFNPPSMYAWEYWFAQYQ